MADKLRMAERTTAVAVWACIGILIAITLVFAALRVIEDLPHLVAGTAPAPQEYGASYVRAPWLAYLHIVPGVIYLIGAPLQLSRRFRSGHLRRHRTLGRILLPLGLLSGVFAVVYGSVFAFGGPWESVAAVAFGSWFVVCLLLAYRAIRRRDITHHRRWMIRAFAVGLGVGTIRIWVALFAASGLLTLQPALAPAFWLGLSMHVIAGELWIRWRPSPAGSRPSPAGSRPSPAGWRPSPAGSRP